MAFPVMVGLFTVWCCHRPSHTLSITAKTVWRLFQLVYSVMYRYICIDFGYLSVIVSSTGRIFSRPTVELA